MTDAEYRLFAELLRRHCGLHFGPEARFRVEKRIAARMREVDAGSFAAYHYLLCRNGTGVEQELLLLVDALTTNETYFFREAPQLRALVEEILPEHLARRGPGGPPLVLWSAGCSSGEEPYSVVMMALEAGLVPGRDLRIYASDISARMLHAAREGVYREAAFRETDAALRRRYFVEREGLFRIADEVKKHVDFIRLNLTEGSKLALLGSLDVILCRNVLIYFDAESRRRVIETFHEKLRPGGHLLLGHSESLMNVSTAFELRHLRNDMVYRRPGRGEGLRRSWAETAEAALADADGQRTLE